MTLPTVMLRVMRLAPCAVLFRTGSLLGVRRTMIVGDGCVTVGMPAVLGSLPSQASRLLFIGMSSPAIRLPVFKARVMVVGLSKRRSHDDHVDNRERKDAHQGCSTLQDIPWTG